MNGNYRFKFVHPFRCIVAGPSQSGKSFFTKQLISRSHELIQPPPTQIIWAFGEANATGMKEIQSVSPVPITFVEGLPDMTEISEGRTLIILDDLMHHAGKSQTISEIFTQMSHHRNISIILMLQNIFHQGRSMRDVSINTKYMVLFKNPRDNGQIKYLSRQIYPGNSNFLLDAFNKATSRPHGYLILDFAQSTPENRRILTGIFSPPEVTIGYIPMKKKEYKQETSKNFNQSRFVHC